MFTGRTKKEEELSKRGEGRRFLCVSEDECLIGARLAYWNHHDLQPAICLRTLIESMP